MEENFDIGVYVNILPRMTSSEAGPSGDVFEHKENEGEVGEGSSVALTGGVHPLEIDAECMDDEGGGSEDEHAADNDDPAPAIHYFCAVGLLDCTVVDYSHIYVWGYQNSDIQIRQQFHMKEGVIHFISNFVVNTRREHNCTRPEPRAYEVRCTKYPDCHFFVRAHMPIHENYFVITRYTPHACSEESIRNMSRIINARFIAQLTFYRTADYFCDRGNSAATCDTRFSSKVKEILEKRRGKAHHRHTRIFDLQYNEFEIRCKRQYASAYSVGDTIQQCQLRSNEATFTCNKSKLQHIPCSHVIAACKDMGGNDASQYISPFYTAEALKNTWRLKIRSFATGSNHKAIEGPTWIPYPQAKRKEPGKPRGT
jgi:hypothetical protein